MDNKLFRKGLIFGVIALIIGVSIQPVFAISLLKSDKNRIEFSMYDNKTSNPDLKITDIYIENYFPFGPCYFWIKYKNIGVVETPNNRLIILEINVTKKAFGNQSFEYKNIHKDINYQLKPGESKIFNFGEDYREFWEPGIYKLKCTINPDKTINETHYTNNNRNEILIGVDIGGEKFWFSFRWF